MNCWEYQKCKPEIKEQCPAYPYQGHICFKVTGTMCKGVRQDNPLKKQSFCNCCNFYNSTELQK